VIELLASYNGAPPMFGVSIVRFRGDRIARESIYAMEGFEPAGWRNEWVTPFDRLTSVSPAEWQDGARFGIELGSPAT
jgi:hypothetical protein